MMDRHYQIDRWIPDGSKILDLGCGDGSFLKDLSEKNFFVRNLAFIGTSIFIFKNSLFFI